MVIGDAADVVSNSQRETNVGARFLHDEEWLNIFRKRNWSRLAAGLFNDWDDPLFASF